MAAPSRRCRQHHSLHRSPRQCAFARCSTPQCLPRQRRRYHPCSHPSRGRRTANRRSTPPSSAHVGNRGGHPTRAPLAGQAPLTFRPIPPPTLSRKQGAAPHSRRHNRQHPRRRASLPRPWRRGSPTRQRSEAIAALAGCARLPRRPHERRAACQPVAGGAILHAPARKQQRVASCSFPPQIQQSCNRPGQACSQCRALPLSAKFRKQWPPPPQLLQVNARWT